MLTLILRYAIIVAAAMPINIFAKDTPMLYERYYADAAADAMPCDVTRRR